MQNQSIKKKWSLLFLSLSLLLNGLLLGLFALFFLVDNFFTPTLPFAFKRQCAVEPFLATDPLVAHYRTLSFDQLVALLEDTTMLREPICARDLALAICVADHDLDLARALAKEPLFHTPLVEQESLYCYSHLEDRDFQRIALFAKIEKHPFTLQGIYKRLKEEKEPSLVEALCRRPEFHLMQTLFACSERSVDQKILVGLILEGSLETLVDFYEMQRQNCSFEAPVRQELLLRYLDQNSRVAAYLLLATDFSFAKRSLDEKHLVRLLLLLNQETPMRDAFLKELVASHKSQVVKSKASELLGDEVAGRFIERPGIGQLRPKFREPVPASPAPNQHIVRRGESLWLIAQKYNLSVQQLIQVNGLQTTTLRVGQVLTIPRSG